MKNKYLGAIVRFFIRLSIAYLVFCAVLFFTQDYLIFPALKVERPNVGKKRTPPDGIVQYFVETEDGEKLEVWNLEAPINPEIGKWVAVLHHGNGEFVEHSRGFQKWLAGFGIESYAFDYRGYGRSSGWPTEAGLYQDVDAVFSFAKERAKQAGYEDVKLLSLGRSVGSGLAGYGSVKHKAKILLLFSGYSSLPEVVKELPLYAPFSWVLSYELPTAKYIRKLSNACVIAVHGKRDTVIPFTNLARIAQSATDANLSSTILPLEGVGHHNVFDPALKEIEQSLTKCLKI